ncbi:hypothetical protein [uncultured Halopseudomonas sp.]|uniref:hypothetical protein n=1 Tax=uncultured Halopseudomonas sp. TaxID=2901193 RepID=UPI0030EB19E4|tara:strand:- start:58375 stop:58617 length:243 start_codon:yes stop_codon:yes gene_type:complete
MEAIVEYLMLFTGLLLVPVAISLFIAAALKKSKKLAKLALVLAAVSLALLVREHYSEFWSVDSCMDMGGRYNYEQQDCEY